MVVSTRALTAVGLGILGVAFLVGPSLGQQPQDPAVRKAATQASAPKPQAPTPVTVGCVDISQVFKGYDRVKFNSEEFKAAVMGKKNELMKLMAEAQQESETLAKLTPGSVDFKKHEDRITQLKAQHEASREQYEREFQLREAEMLATIYKDVQSVVTRIAQYKGFNYVVRIENDPITGSNTNAAMMAIARSVVYADPRNDITNDVIYHLNREYKANGGTPPKPATSAAPVQGAPGIPAPGSPPGN
jgi:outer membrane protein